MPLDKDDMVLASGEYLRGAFIRLRREASNTTLNRVALKVGVSQPYLSKLERGEIKKPKPEVLARLVRCLNLDTFYMEVRISESGQLVATLRKVHARARSS